MHSGVIISYCTEILGGQKRKILVEHSLFDSECEWPQIDFDCAIDIKEFEEKNTINGSYSCPNITTNLQKLKI